MTGAGGSGAPVPATMLAAVLYGREDLRLEEVPVPALGPADMLIRLDRCGVCGSDVRSYERGPSARYMSPVILGHELVGRVAALGAEVDGFAPGDRVTVAPAIPCGVCAACRRGDDNLCSDLLDFGINVAGGMAEYMLVPARSLAAGGVVVVPPELPDAAAILGEPRATCLRGEHRGRVGPGSTVVVMGDGPIGLTHAVLARHLGAQRIIVAGLSPARLDVVGRAGFETLDVSPGDPVRLLKDVLTLAGADTVICAAPDPRVIETAMAVVRAGGTVVAFGGLAGDPAIRLDGNQIHYGELTLVGSFNCTTADFREAMGLAAAVDADLFQAQTFPLQEARAAFEVARRREVMKAVITMEQRND
jgi:L-iditol 2-dehydrogenase